MKSTIALTLLALLAMLIGCGPQPESTTTILNPALKIRGAEITAAAGKTLVGKVQEKMADGGVEEALSYCSFHAYSLTDSLAEIHGAHIKRTALKFRNPANEPDSLERAVLSRYAASGVYESVLMHSARGTAYFEPIVLKGFCQTCHGTPGQSLAFETDSIIKSIYPNDAATGFAEGDLRGMWAIYFKE